MQAVTQTPKTQGSQAVKQKGKKEEKCFYKLYSRIIIYTFMIIYNYLKEIIIDTIDCLPIHMQVTHSTGFN